MRWTLLWLAAAAWFPLAASAWTPRELWEAWPESRWVETPAPCFRHEALSESLQALAERHGDDLGLEIVGQSVQRRAIYQLEIGRGERKVLLWSQMHGDEPSATPALLDLVDYLLTQQRDQPSARLILEELTLVLVPMLNPDGAEQSMRRNAQGIDINRDAMRLATPEGRLLKRLRDEHEPILGFNLHDQDRRNMVGETGVLATSAVLAVAGDLAGTLTPGRMRAERAGAAIVSAVETFFPGGTARFDDDWNPRAFGDRLTSWGTPVVLLESGGLPPDRPVTDLARLNFVALLSVLEALARDDLAAHDASVYRDLPHNERGARADVVIRGARLLQPGAGPAYPADVAFQIHRSDQELAGCLPPRPGRSSILEIGDAHLLSAAETIDAEGAILLAPFQLGVRGWDAREWLDAELLTSLARLGVARVVWSVAAEQLAAAQDHGRQVAGNGRPVLDAIVETVLPEVELHEPPHLVGAAETLDDVFRGLSADHAKARARRPGSEHGATVAHRLAPLAAASPPRPSGACGSLPRAGALGALRAGRRDHSNETRSLPNSDTQDRKAPTPAVAPLLEALWGFDGPPARPILTPGMPASFLLVEADAGGELVAEQARILGIWLDGVDILRGEG